MALFLSFVCLVYVWTALLASSFLPFFPFRQWQVSSISSAVWSGAASNKIYMLDVAEEHFIEISPTSCDDP